jgi:hypothetical protein
MKTKTKLIVNGGLIACVVAVVFNLYASPDLPFDFPWNFPKPTPTIDAAPNPKIPHPDSERVVTFKMDRDWSGKVLIATVIAVGIYDNHDISPRVKNWSAHYTVPRDSEVFFIIDIPPHGKPPNTVCRIEVGGLLAVGPHATNATGGSGKLTCSADIL